MNVSYHLLGPNYTEGHLSFKLMVSIVVLHNLLKLSQPERFALSIMQLYIVPVATLFPPPPPPLNDWSPCGTAQGLN